MGRTYRAILLKGILVSEKIEKLLLDPAQAPTSTRTSTCTTTRSRRCVLHPAQVLPGSALAARDVTEFSSRRAVEKGAGPLPGHLLNSLCTRQQPYLKLERSDVGRNLHDLGLFRRHPLRGDSRLARRVDKPANQLPSGPLNGVGGAEKQEGEGGWKRVGH
jgi:hypothetical protein